MIDLVRRKSDDDDDAADGLVMDGGEEGALTLNETPRVEWPHFYNSPRLKVYRLAGAVSLVSLVCVTVAATWGGSDGRDGRDPLMLVLFTGFSVVLSL